MFEVRTASPFDDDWEERDAEIRAAAGVSSDHSGCGFGQRDHGFRAETFEDAAAMKDRLNQVRDVTATIREV